MIPVMKMEIIQDVNYIMTDRGLKAVVRTRRPTFAAALVCGGGRFEDAFNLREPYDRKTHVFYLGDRVPAAAETLTLICRRKEKSRREKRVSFVFGAPALADPQALYREYDAGLTPAGTETEILADGVEYAHILYRDKAGAPVHAFWLKIDSKKASLYVGTPQDGYAARKVRAKVPEMIDAAVRNGVNAVAAMNADFFDIFGDFSPSGLCVKNGLVIANADSPRPFLGIKKDGAPVIASLPESPGLLNGLSQAAAGLQMIVKDGKPFDWAPLEPFSFVRHPRTAAGVTKDGTILLLEVDGRIPDYSNGASLVDLAELMIKNGADRAINLDGGGSSITYIKKDGGFVLQSNPADLFRPNAKLIRKEFNCLLVTGPARR